MKLQRPTREQLLATSVVAIVFGMIGGAIAYSVILPAPSTVTSSTTVYTINSTTITLEDTSLSQQVSSLSTVVQAQGTAITSLGGQLSNQQSQINGFKVFIVYELVRESVSGSSIVVGCATKPITDLVRQYTGRDLSSTVAGLVQTALLTASFNLTSATSVSQNVFRANGTVSIGVTITGVINPPIHEPIGITALVDTDRRTVSGLTCTNVGTPSLG